MLRSCVQIVHYLRLQEPPPQQTIVMVAPAITSLDATVAGGCAQEYTINRTWTATDALWQYKHMPTNDYG